MDTYEREMIILEDQKKRKKKKKAIKNLMGAKA
jgi:hypothetical protein